MRLASKILLGSPSIQFARRTCVSPLTCTSDKTLSYPRWNLNFFRAFTGTQHRSFDVVNPATEEVIASVNADTTEMVADKVALANTGQKMWSKIPVQIRKATLSKFCDLLERDTDTLAETLSQEMGKTPKQAAGEIQATRGRIKFLVDNVESVLEPVTMNDSPSEKIQYEPLGVVANISAWNFPYFVSSNVFAAALLTGNAVVFKPSEITPLTGAAITALLHEAGVPEDVMLLTQGGGEVGAALASSKDVRGVFFTGSNRTGRAIAAAAAPNMCKIQLELGGKDPAYVRADVADVAAVAASIADGAMYNNGQSCCAVERVYVHSAVAQQFTAAFKAEVEAFKVGDPADDATFLGPLARQPALDHLNSQLQDAVSKGAKVLVGAGEVPSKGYYFPPTVLTDVDHSMSVMKEESFGPIVGIQVVQSDEEAVELMNDQDFGLTASVWTTDENAALAIFDQLDTGTVYWNCCDRVSPRLPWSGRKGSGVGSTLSIEGLRTFVQPKAMHLQGNS